jgi:hypothetical protein
MLCLLSVNLFVPYDKLQASGVRKNSAGTKGAVVNSQSAYFYWYESQHDHQLTHRPLAGDRLDHTFLQGAGPLRKRSNPGSGVLEGKIGKIS